MTIRTRTDPDVAKHKGLTMFVVNMKAPGVTARPLRQMSGGAEFNEVFFDDVVIPDSERLGDVGAGWSVAITTLMAERFSLGGGGGELGISPDAVADSGASSDPGAFDYSSHREQIADFLKTLDRGAESSVDGREGRKAVEMIIGIYQSAQSGKAVKLPL